MTALGRLPGDGEFMPSKARGISADGQVVVGFSGSASGAEAFRWSAAEGMEGLGDLPGGTFSSEALSVSANGQVVVGYANSEQGQEAFRWTRSGGMATLGTFSSGYFYSEALDLSADGSMVVGYGLSKLGQRAFIWDERHGMRDLRDVLINSYGLDLEGWTLQMAWAMSDDGFTIVGKGTNRHGNEEAWIARLIPLP
jgi:probable HAF family extracellular repeat protein